MNTALQALRSFLSALAPPSERENMEAYLAQSQSLADLESRERQWHRHSADRALISIGVRSH
jgi:Protein of unknown function (DUF3563)